MKKKNNYWNNYDNCYQEAQKYKSLNELKKYCGSAFLAASKNNWIKDYVWLTRRKLWNYELTYIEAQKYKSKAQFKNNNNSAYNSARRNGWLKDYIWLNDNRFNLFTDEIDCVYAYEFVEQNSVYIGRTLIKLQKQRDYQHIFGKDSVSTFARENNISIPEMKILETNLTIKEGAENEGVWIELYRESGWKIINKAKAGSIGGLGKMRSKYTYETCYQEALKYRTRGEFHKNNSGAYNCALRNKWLDDYKWFEDGFQILSQKRKFWTYEKCLNEAIKYQYLIDFKKHSGCAYNASIRYKYIDSFTFLKRSHDNLSYDDCYNYAKQCKFLKEFDKKFHKAYRKSVLNKWLKDFSWLIRIKNNKNEVN